MDDNSCPHHAHLVNEFLHDDNIARLEWPACSPDMNPIEHAWDTLKRAVFGRDDPPTTLTTNKYGRGTERHLPKTDENIVRPTGERR